MKKRKRRGKSKKGLASVDMGKRREIAKKGGFASGKSEKHYKWSSENARKAVLKRWTNKNNNLST